MRLNRFIAAATDLSRRKADDAIADGRVLVNGQQAATGQVINDDDTVILDGDEIRVNTDKPTVLLLNKPVGYVCSKDGQGAPTVYDLIPEEYQQLNIAGRLDKDSSGLVIMTDDGDLLQELTHPSNNKEKVYEVTLDRELTKSVNEQLKTGVDIGDDRPSKFKNVTKIGSKTYRITLEEGRNRQIRKTFNALSAHVQRLHRIKVGIYSLDTIQDVYSVV